jgi:hypothetical protein
VTLGKIFYNLLLTQEAVAAPSYCQIFFLITFLKEVFVRNIIILCINCIIIIRINDNAVINNNYGRLQDLILLFRIPMSTLKDIFEVYVQFRHAPPQKVRLPCPGLTFGCSVTGSHMTAYKLRH